ncbi:phage tail protein [Cellulomonas sp. HZM]|uniref:phage tail protein n=1 Tax=Cellulomonas sp. HZM TaxID=1454010 RepID=UPI000555DFBB|nr:phage tail protein [Cellulomonas sp. HZM]
MTGRAPDWLLRQLPHGMLAEDFFVRFVSIFQAQAETLLQHADNLPHLADPDLTPPAMVREMGRWLGLEGIDASYPEAAQRQILRTASATLQWRGTLAGLRRLVELYSDGPVRVSESGGVFAEGEAPDDVAWVVVETASTGPLSEADLVALVLDEIPAHVHAEVRVAGRVVWPQQAQEHESELAS